jgi:ABC-type phosphate/phosphonate transport system substrate-binding protein
MKRDGAASDEERMKQKPGCMRRPLSGGKWASWVLLTISLASSALLTLSGPTRAVWAEATRKPEFIVGYSNKTLADVDPKDATAALKIYTQELGREVGYNTEGKVYDSTDVMIRDANQGKLDLIALTSLEYLRVKGRFESELAIAHVRDGKSKHTYLILVRSDRQFADVGSLKNKRISVLKGDEVGMLFLNTTLLKQGHPEARNFFSEVDEKSKTSQAVLSVFFGQADGCIVDDVAFKTMGELNPQVLKNLTPLVQSGELLTSLSVFRAALPLAMKDEVLAWARRLREYPKGRQVLMLFKVDDIVPVRESDLEGVKRLAAEYDRLRRKR